MDENQNRKQKFKWMSPAEHSRRRRATFEGLIYHGDWQTPLYAALIEARAADIKSPTIRTLVNKLAARLEEVDECVHKITQYFEPPEGIQPEFFVGMLYEGMLRDTLQCTIEGRVIRVTALIRGTRDYAKSYVQYEIRSAVDRSRFQLSHYEWVLDGHLE